MKFENTFAVDAPIDEVYATLLVVERDEANHRAFFRARWSETRGQGTADARVDLALDQQGETTNGTMVADVQLAGRAAAMGRGVIQDVSAKIVSTFSQNLEAMLAGGGAAAPEAAAAGAGAGTGGDRAAAAAGATTGGAPPSRPQATGAEAGGGPEAAPPTTPPPPGTASAPTPTPPP